MKKQIKAIIEERIEANRKDLAFYQEIKELIKSLEGKPMNRRTFSKRLLEQYNLKYIEDRSDVYLERDGKQINIFQGLMNSDRTVRMKYFERGATPFSASADRINKLENCNLEVISTLFETIQNHYEGLKECFKELKANKIDSYHFPPYYMIINMIEGEQRHDNKVLGTFQFIK